MGFLSAAEVIECSVTDLISSYVGGSGQKVIRMFEKALGKILFIDEAYRLGEINAVDAIGEMVGCMTKKRFFGNLVVVLAGYKEDMEKLMLRNRGLRSRFATYVDFQPLKEQDMLSRLQKHLAEVNIELGGIDPDAMSWSRDEVLRMLSQLSKMQSWANGRDIVAFARTVIEHVYTREEPQETGKDLILHADDLVFLLNGRLSRARKDEEEMGIRHETRINGDRKENGRWDRNVNGGPPVSSNATSGFSK
jgi:SpoVK/Ycf46/Vps4 family AAA+-type ATPase